MRNEHTLVPEMLVFATVVELRGFAAAARRLELTTSAVSRSVGRLEAHWGAKLLHRTTRSISLTELGAEVYAGCAQMVQLAREVHATAGHYGDTPRGKVRMTAPEVFGEIWLAPQLPAFRARWPEVEVAVQLTDRMVDLVEEGLDLAIRLTMPAQLPPGMVARALCQVRYIAMASPAWLRQLPGPLTQPAALADLPCITLGYGEFQNQLRWEPVATTPPGKVTEGTQAPQELRVHAPLSISNSVGILALALQQQGVGIVADFAALEALEQGRLVQLFPDWQLAGPYAPRTAYALYPPSRHLPLKVRAFIDHLVRGEG
ncbi:MAG: LysR family transcriptional regulator [Comamonas sp.]|jgi:DNA-binding transcriptional LysR family regulator|uniref:LysR family transcriptional regulator n=1 Tax=Comamonas sp. TaxID=34028 RepID=UPI002831380D|nr:LysR family transcriptional regulator [Comamonas sp.]MDR0215732.1 LysR family transcriptional regulator [Comamonas sp.]